MSSFKADRVDTRPLTVESNHSTVQFIVPISNGITRVTGKFNDYTIDIDYNDDDFIQSTISATIKVESIDTGIDARDDHLRTADFFDVEQFPEITFISEDIIQKEDFYMVKGQFTMHGVKKTIEFPLKITGNLFFLVYTQRGQFNAMEVMVWLQKRKPRERPLQRNAQ